MAAPVRIRSLALTSRLPGATSTGGRRGFERAGAPIVPDDQRPDVAVQAVTRGYFATLGVSLVAGRDFEPGDRAGAAPVAIVSRQFAAQQWGGEAIGQRVRLFTRGAPGDWLTVVGVVPEIGRSQEQGGEPAVYLPHAQEPGAAMWVLVRGSRAAEPAVRVLRVSVRRLDGDLPLVSQPTALTDWLAGAYRYRAVMAGLFAIFAVIAVLLACLGLYASVTQVVQARTREIGIRTVLGATASQILTLVLGDAGRAVGGGAAIGVVVWLVAVLAAAAGPRSLRRTRPALQLTD